ncbi:LuxR C-terminal-related transcriptional regulator (plasmid) [Streptomyces sp. CA-294286]|uniref:response regulator transcription factor n=1 Tax=Streptomyces sp. CA-294286 TaxID=3240070 RepID=UPI003D93B4DC
MRWPPLEVQAGPDHCGCQGVRQEKRQHFTGRADACGGPGDGPRATAGPDIGGNGGTSYAGAESSTTRNRTLVRGARWRTATDHVPPVLHGIRTGTLGTARRGNWCGSVPPDPSGCQMKERSVIRVQVDHAAGLFSSALASLLREEEDLDVSCGVTDPCSQDPGWAEVWVTDAEKLPPRFAAPCVPTSRRGRGARTGRDTGGRRGSELSGRARADRAVGPAMPKGAGLLVLAAARRPGVLRRALEAGALGYVDKEGSPQRLLEGVRSVARGERYVDGSLAADLLHATDIPLTPRELNVLSLAGAGAGVGEIALALHLSPGTVRNYLAAAIRKTGARNRVDAIRIAHGAGWV